MHTEGCSPNVCGWLRGFISAGIMWEVLFIFSCGIRVLFFGITPFMRTRKGILFGLSEKMLDSTHGPGSLPEKSRVQKKFIIQGMRARA